jgi:hypothetical protein
MSSDGQEFREGGASGYSKLSDARALGLVNDMLGVARATESGPPAVLICRSGLKP